MIQSFSIAKDEQSVNVNIVCNSVFITKVEELGNNKREAKSIGIERELFEAIVKTYEGKF